MSYLLSQKADKDFENIYRYFYLLFNEHQANQYTNSLEACFIMLAKNPNHGKNIHHIQHCVFHHKHEKHTIFYRIHNTQLLIIHLLHESMDITPHL